MPPYSAPLIWPFEMNVVVPWLHQPSTLSSHASNLLLNFNLCVYASPIPNELTTVLVVSSPSLIVTLNCPSFWRGKRRQGTSLGYESCLPSWRLWITSHIVHWNCTAPKCLTDQTDGGTTHLGLYATRRHCPYTRGGRRVAIVTLDVGRADFLLVIVNLHINWQKMHRL